MRNIQDAPVHFSGLAILALIMVGAYIQGVRPALRASDDLAAATAETENLEKIAPRLSRDNQELTAQLEAHETALREKYVLKTRDDQAVLELVSQMLREHDLDLVNFQEEIVSSANIRADLQIKGDYEDLVLLLFDFRMLDRPARITSLQLSATDSAGEVCLAKLQIDFSPVPNRT